MTKLPPVVHTYTCCVCQDTAFTPGPVSRRGNTSVQPCSSCEAGLALWKGWYGSAEAHHKTKRPARPKNKSILPTDAPRHSAWHSAFQDGTLNPKALVTQANAAERDRAHLVREAQREIVQDYKIKQAGDSEDEEPPF